MLEVVLQHLVKIWLWLVHTVTSAGEVGDRRGGLAELVSSRFREREVLSQMVKQGGGLER